MSLHVARVALNLVVRLPEHVFERHLPASPYVVGEALADAVIAHVREQDLGYYPALDYLREQQVLEPDLIEAAENIGWFASNLVREEVRRKLRPVFSNVAFQSQQVLAFTLPGVRPGQPNSRAELIRHYTPDTIKVGLLLSMLRKVDQPEAMARWASNTTHRWLKNSFEDFAVTSAEPV